MKQIIYLLGLNGVGKTTIGEAIAKKTGFALLDNHLVYREICYFLPLDSKESHSLNGQLHLAILKILLKSDTSGVVCTLSIRPDPSVVICKRAVQMIEQMEHKVNFVKIECNWEEHKRRATSFSRQVFTKVNTIKKLKERIANPVFKGLNVHPPLIINNTNLSPEEVATKIISAFKIK